MELKPSPRLNVVEWADKYRYLSAESSSTPGKWYTDAVEPARGPMLAVTEPGVKKITIMGPTQLLKTEFINNVVGYFIHQDPAPMVVLQPKKEMAETWSKDRLEPMIRDTPVLTEVFGKAIAGTILHKPFPGGHVTGLSARSPSDVAMRPVRVTNADEIDKYPDSVGEEGDAISLLEERSSTFYNALSIAVCSPTIKGRSKIADRYEQSDKRRFHGKCPYCGELEDLRWSQVKFTEENPEAAYYECSHCEAQWSEADKLKATSKGNGCYIATAPFKGHAGFYVNKLASPWPADSMANMARKFVDSRGNVEKEKAFSNTQLAETYEEVGEAPDHMRLYERREDYNTNTIPKDVVFLTAGVDIQNDRAEVEIVGWCRNKRSYSIDYRILMCDTSQTSELERVLGPILNETWVKVNGLEIQIQIMNVDSGHRTRQVYDWVASKNDANRVRAIKGRKDLEMVFGIPKDTEVNRDGTKLKRAVKVWPLGVSFIKTELYSWLQLAGAGDSGIYPDGFCHFPQYDEEHFKRLCSEKKLTKKHQDGSTTTSYVTHYERNEQLDCRVYARAAAAMFGIDRFKDQDWDVLEGKFDLPQPVKSTPPAATREESKPEDSNNKFWERQNRKFWP